MRRHLRKPKSKWVVFYFLDGTHRTTLKVPCPVARGWYRWRWQARRRLRYLETVVDYRWQIASAEEYERLWGAYEGQWAWTGTP